MSDVRQRHRRIRGAVESGDLERAIELQTAMTAADWPIDELLDEFRNAIEADAIEEAETVRHQIREQLATRRIEERYALRRSATAREDPSLGIEERQELNAHVESAIELSASRSAFLTASMLYLTEPDEADATQVIEETAKLEDREQDYEMREGTAEPIVEEVTVPADLEIVSGGVDGGAIAPNNPTRMAVIVANTGDEDALDVEVEVAVPDDVAVSPRTRSIGTVAGGVDTVAEFTVTATMEGTHRLAVTASGETGGSSQTRISVTVDSDGDRSPLLEEFSDTDGTVRFEDVVRAIAHFNEETPIPETETAVTFQDVLWIIEEFNRA